MSETKTTSCRQDETTADLSEIIEGYDISQLGDLTMIVVNVSPEKRNHVFSTLCGQVKEEAYFALEYEDRSKASKTRDVYFWMWISRDEFWKIYARYHDLIVGSCAISFGYATHYGEDEVYITPYKTIKIFTKDPVRYLAILENLGFRQTLCLSTPPISLAIEETIDSREISDITEMLNDLIRSKLRFAKRYIID